MIILNVLQYSFDKKFHIEDRELTGERPWKGSNGEEIYRTSNF